MNRSLLIHTVSSGKQSSSDSRFLTNTYCGGDILQKAHLHDLRSHVTFTANDGEGALEKQ